jgi:hypothetical protein
MTGGQPTVPVSGTGRRVSATAGCKGGNAELDGLRAWMRGVRFRRLALVRDTASARTARTEMTGG